MPAPQIMLSVVSHRHNSLVNGLLGDLARFCGGDISIVLTQNVADPVPFATEKLAAPVEIITNDQPKGFGANHNAAFSRCRTPFYCVMNPDIRLDSCPFPALLDRFDSERVGVVGPLVRSPTGNVEDSARRYPTVASLARKLFIPRSGPDYSIDRGPVEVDWVGGMCMLVRSDTYRALGGFDEAYFMYYEDVDLCRRVHAHGKTVLYHPGAEVIHAARRESRRNPRLTFHHLASAARFLFHR